MKIFVFLFIVRAVKQKCINDGQEVGEVAQKDLYQRDPVFPPRKRQRETQVVEWQGSYRPLSLTSLLMNGCVIIY